jgi:alpha-galactosidase
VQTYFNFGLILTIILLNGCAEEKNYISTVKEHPITREKIVAFTPPMGWNSFDAYDCAINEEQFRATVDFMADSLLEYGWEYAVIDYIWWHPDPGNWDTPRRFGHPNIRYKEDGEPLHPEYTTMDEYGRLFPAVKRFPSAANGKGFKPLADYVHSKGIKFGIHIMRGIHRAAYYYNTPILGSTNRARDIGEPWDTCPWCNHMYGVDATKAGAQEYYNSLFNLYAQWGVDYIKVDDMQVPPYHQAELELIRKAIDQCNRPMVLSLSPGEAPLSRARHLEKNANLWRISADFWDEWESLLHNFDLLNAWSSYIQPNHWPDADMLPIGHISLGGRPHGPDRMSHFTWPEHYTLMSLWCMARSPLMMGGDLLTSSEQSLSFLKNKEVLAIHQNSNNNRQIYKRNNAACWMADIPGSDNKYLGLFNLGEKRAIIDFVFEWEMLRGEYHIRDLWKHKDLGNFKDKFEAELDPHGAGLYLLKEL